MKLSLILVGLLISTCSLYPTIVEMNEFYHPELNQTIILAHDFHFKHLPATDMRQSEDACSKIHFLEGFLITESRFPKDSLMGIDLLANTCHKQRLGVASAEFRSAYGEYVTIMVEALNSGKNYDEMSGQLKAPEVAYVVGRLFLLSHLENGTRLFSNLNQYVRSIPPLKENQKYLEQFDELLIKAHEDGNKINEWMGKDFSGDENSFKDLANKLVDELLIKEDNGGASLNRESIHHTLERASNALLDASLLKELHQKRNERVVFMHAGALHLKALAETCLPKIGYEMKSSISHFSQLMQLMEAKRKAQQDVKKIMQSEEFDQCAVDVKSFLDKCKTFPK